jgi:hypothetical protein
MAQALAVSRYILGDSAIYPSTMLRMVPLPTASPRGGCIGNTLRPAGFGPETTARCSA